MNRSICRFVKNLLICGMIIGIDARFYGPIGGGGLGRYTKELIDHLEIMDQENDYIIFLRHENWDDYKPRNPNFKKVLAPYAWYGWKEQLFMPFKIWREKIDLMHFPHFNTPILYVCGIKLFSEMANLKWINRIFTRIHAKTKTNPREICRNYFILTIHDLILLKYPSKKATTLAPIYFRLKFFAYKIVISAALKKAKQIIVPSEYVKNDITKYFKINPDKIEVIYEGVVEVDKENGFGENRFVEKGNHGLKIVDKGEYSAGGKKFRESQDGREGKEGIEGEYILYVGNAYPHKNLERLVSAFWILVNQDCNLKKKDFRGLYADLPAQAGRSADLTRKRRFQDIKLILVGQRNYFYERLEQYAGKNFPDVKNRVIFFGYATDKELADLYKNASLYVFPSLEEGFGLPPFEAMSYGAPVVSSKSSCLPEILGDAALYFDANDIEDMANKILQGLEDKKLRGDLVKKGYERIKMFDWKENAQRTMEIYFS